MKRTTELIDVFGRSGIEDIAIKNEGKTISEVAEEVIASWNDVTLLRT